MSRTPNVGGGAFSRVLFSGWREGTQQGSHPFWGPPTYLDKYHSTKKGDRCFDGREAKGEHHFKGNMYVVARIVTPLGLPIVRPTDLNQRRESIEAAEHHARPPERAPGQPRGRQRDHQHERQGLCDKNKPCPKPHSRKYHGRG